MNIWIVLIQDRMGGWYVEGAYHNEDWAKAHAENALERPIQWMRWTGDSNTVLRSPDCYIWETILIQH